MNWQIPSLIRTLGPFLVMALVLFGAVQVENSPAFGQTDHLSKALTDMSIEELMEIKVTSVSRKKQKASEAASAVFVITQEDIRRSGATSIPEVLRMVPGVEVARIDANKWAISVRGFTDRFSNKLLVLIDGRSVYTPLFSGVYWDVQDTLLEDIDRIEVIRGPGATSWGANAVNGVINVITKSARETQGGLVSGGWGSEEHGFGAARYGDRISDNAYFRVYAKYFNRDGSTDISGKAAADDWSVLRGGGRLDWSPSDRDQLTLQGDVYDGCVGITDISTLLTPPFRKYSDVDARISGGNLLGRWTRRLSDESDLSLQLYYDRTARRDLLIDMQRDTVEVDFQHRFQGPARQEIVWGLGYRGSSDDLRGSFTIAFTPEGRRDDIFSAFLQDEIGWLQDRLRLTVGSKFEHNDYSGFEFQPSLRLLWVPRDRQAVWAAVSRAVRTPSRTDQDARINYLTLPDRGRGLLLFALRGDRAFRSEDLYAYEVGYRLQPHHRVSFDWTAYYNVYNHLENPRLDLPYFESNPFPPHLVIPGIFSNRMKGHAYGTEIAVPWNVTERWRLTGGYSFIRLRMSHDILDLNDHAARAEGRSPRHQAFVQSHWEVLQNLELDAWLKVVDRLQFGEVPGYTRFDLRLGWQPRSDLDVSLCGQNLLDDRHWEIEGLSDTFSTNIDRSVYGKVTWLF